MVITMAKATTDMQGAGGTKKAPIRVKQDMIDFIKTQGMTRALKRAGEIKASGKGGEAEFLEGVRRMYGANRLAAATKAATPAKFTAPAGANKKPAGRMSKSAAPAPKKKSGGLSTGAKVTGGVIAGAATLALTRNPKAAAAVASKIAPRAAKVLGVASKASPKNASNVMAKKLSSVREQAANKALSASGRAAAKANRPVSQSQYDAMRAQAARKGVKPPVKTMPKKKAVAGAGMGATTLKGDTKKTTKK